MSQGLEWLNFVETWLRSHIELIAVAQTATLLVIYGDYINEIVRVALKPYPFLIRLTAFVLLCAFGFGALGVFAAELYGNLLIKLDRHLLLPVIAAIFLLLGMGAERGVLSRGKSALAR